METAVKDGAAESMITTMLGQMEFLCIDLCVLGTITRGVPNPIQIQVSLTKIGMRPKTKMMHRVKVDTTIKGGLRVTAQANVHTCLPQEYPGRNYLEELEIRFHSGHLFTGEISKADDNKVCEEIFAAFNAGKHN